MGISSSLSDGTGTGTGPETKTQLESSSCIEVSKNNNNNIKRLFQSAVVNGLIVYTHVRKSLFNCFNEFSDDDWKKQLTGLGCNVLLKAEIVSIGD